MGMAWTVFTLITLISQGLSHLKLKLFGPPSPNEQVVDMSLFDTPTGTLSSEEQSKIRKARLSKLKISQLENSKNMEKQLATKLLGDMNLNLNEDERGEGGEEKEGNGSGQGGGLGVEGFRFANGNGNKNDGDDDEETSSDENEKE